MRESKARAALRDKTGSPLVPAAPRGRSGKKIAFCKRSLRGLTHPKQIKRMKPFPSHAFESRYLRTNWNANRGSGALSLPSPATRSKASVNRPIGTRTGVQGVTPCRPGVQGHCPCLPLPRVRKWVKLASWNANRGPGALPLVGVTWRPSRRRSEPALR